MLNVLKYIALIGTFFIYTSSGVFSKLASQREFLSPGYIAFLGCTVGVLGIYAVLWQQIIKRMDVSLAYMFKGTGVVFGLMLAHYVFGEAITTTNIVGAVTLLTYLLFFSLTWRSIDFTNARTFSI
jgi:multidrug transporter EmrE-like cation transporter